MDAEIAALNASLQDRLARIATTLEGMSEAQLNWRPPVNGANSAYVLAAHTLGNARAWVLGIACGRDIGRDRPGEFRATGAGARRLLDEHRALCAEIAGALGSLDPRQLDRRLVPAQELWGEGPPHEISVRDALVQVIEHASLHLGHLQLTRDLALGAG
jgi:hypothetical protein